MTTLVPSAAVAEADSDAAAPGDPARSIGPEERAPLTTRRIVVAVVLWSVVVLLSVTLVLYLLEPIFQARHQSDLLAQYRTTVLHAAHELDSLAGVAVPTHPPAYGSSVAVLEIARLHMRQVVVEGVSPKNTAGGPGHVPGTAGLGQSGNAVVVGRKALYGGPFASLDELRRGSRILITTTQGQSVYEVTREQRTSVDSSSLAGLYRSVGSSELTLVTSAGSVPWDSSSGTVVTAKLLGRPFHSTPQNHRAASQSGRRGDASAWLQVVLAIGIFVAAAITAVFLYRRSTLRVGYLLTTPVLIVAVVLLAEAGSRLLPAWS